MPTIDFDPRNIHYHPAHVTADMLERYERERREADIAYPKEQAKMLFTDGSGVLATLADGTSPQWEAGGGVVPGGDWEGPRDDWGSMTPNEERDALRKGYRKLIGEDVDWHSMTPDQQSAAMEKAAIAYQRKLETVQSSLTSGTAKATTIKINTPSYDHRTNYCLADLAACGVDIVQVPSLNVLAQPQYLYPRYDDAGLVIGGAFFIRHAKG